MRWMLSVFNALPFLIFSLYAMPQLLNEHHTRVLMSDESGTLIAGAAGKDYVMVIADSAVTNGATVKLIPSRKLMDLSDPASCAFAGHNGSTYQIANSPIKSMFSLNDLFSSWRVANRKKNLDQLFPKFKLALEQNAEAEYSYAVVHHNFYRAVGDVIGWYICGGMVNGKPKLRSGSWTLTTSTKVTVDEDLADNNNRFRGVLFSGKGENSDINVRKDLPDEALIFFKTDEEKHSYLAWRASEEPIARKPLRIEDALTFLRTLFLGVEQTMPYAKYVRSPNVLRLFTSCRRTTSYLDDTRLRNQNECKAN